MIEDETPAEGEAQPTDENGEAIAPPSETPEDANPESVPETEEDLPVNEVEASVNPEAELGDGVEVDEDGEVIPIAPESVTEGEGGETTVLAGDDESEPLTSGDELPAHRRQVEGV